MTNYELIHNFTSNHMETIENLNVSLYLSEEYFTLYSYNTAIAKKVIKDNLYIISKCTYSNTTSKHQSILRGATIGYKVIYLEDINQTLDYNIESEIDNLRSLCKKQLRAKKLDYTSTIQNSLKNLNEIVQYFKIDKRKKVYKDLLIILNNYNTNSYETTFNSILSLDKEETEKLKVAKVKRDKKIKLELKRNYDNFSNGLLKDLLLKLKDSFTHKDLTLYRSYKDTYNKYSNMIISNKWSEFEYFLYHKDLLKVTDNCNIITSQRVTISKKDAIALYLLIINNKLKVGDTVLQWNVRKVTDSYISIGCHTIAISDIKEVYQILKGCKNV